MNIGLADWSDKRRNLVAVLSPVLLVAACMSMQFAAGAIVGVWAWVPTILLFWSGIAIAVLLFGGRPVLSRWLQPAQGSLWWCVPAAAVGLLSLSGFLTHWQLIGDPLIFVSWLAFGLINPWFEEAYWRGMLIDATASWGGVPSVAYSAAWFALSHPLIWGVHSMAMRRWPVIFALLFVGVIWAVVYRRSKSLRWTVAGHMLANLLGMSVPVLLNMYDPSVH